MLAKLRQLPPRLDAVIERAKRCEEEEARLEAEKNLQSKRRSKLRSAGAVAQLASESYSAVNAASATSDDSGGGAAKRRYTMKSNIGTAAGRVKAQIVGDTRTMSFHASTALFKGGRPAYAGNTHNYPHRIDPNRLRTLMGADLRTASLNAQLREAREAKYENDLNAMAELEIAAGEKLERQLDGQKLRLGRIPTADQWSHSGEMRRRGQISTWRWQPGFYVLCDGLLHEFSGASLSSSIVNAWPVLGATACRGVPSSQAYPHVLELHVSGYYVDEEVLATVELAVSSKEERAQWIDALERESLKVSRLFRETHDRETHLAEVDYLESDEAWASVRQTGNGGGGTAVGGSTSRSSTSSRLARFAGGALARARRKPSGRQSGMQSGRSSWRDGGRAGAGGRGVKSPAAANNRGRSNMSPGAAAVHSAGSRAPAAASRGSSKSPGRAQRGPPQSQRPAAGGRGDKAYLNARKAAVGAPSRRI